MKRMLIHYTLYIYIVNHCIRVKSRTSLFFFFFFHERKNFTMKTQSSERGERIVLVQFPFCFIPISRSVAEIQGFKVSAIFKDYEWTR